MLQVLFDEYYWFIHFVLLVKNKTKQNSHKPRKLEIVKIPFQRFRSMSESNMTYFKMKIIASLKYHDLPFQNMSSLVI